MLSEERQHTRELGVRRILGTRACKTHQRCIRCVHIPSLNLNAEKYIDLIDWQTCVLTEPPIIKSISDAGLEDVGRNKTTHVTEISRFSSHSQAVEGCVKAVT